MQMSLLNMGKGVAIEKFNDELAKVIENIVDPNTDFKVKRQIDLTMKFTPNEERNTCYIEIQSKSKLAPTKAAEAIAFVGIDKKTGEVHVEEFKPAEQGALIPQSKDGKVVAMG
ncbi:hypothetical protein KAR91_12130 [Candidatus Pacearchaeota archaeon]|nr:hypothetical protein [Candidatus Pacearchaeota archaeon]